MKHTQLCTDAAATRASEQIAYDQQWPNHCRACDGRGIFTGSQSVPYGSTSASFDVSEPCGDCTEQGKCPRCGDDGLTCEDRGDNSTGDGPCQICGWNYQDGGRPADYDWCNCWNTEP